MTDEVIAALLAKTEMLEQQLNIIEENKLKKREYHKNQFAKWKAENPERLKELRSVINKRYNDKKKAEKLAAK